MPKTQLDIDQLITDLEIETESVENSSTDLSVSSPQEISVDPSTIYKRLNGLIETGDNLLKTTQYLVNSTPDPENIASAASLIGSVRDVIHEFTVIHRDKLKFDQQMELERYKASEKEKLLKMRLDQTTKTEPTTSDVEMVEFSQEQIINSILKQESIK